MAGAEAEGFGSTLVIFAGDVGNFLHYFLVESLLLPLFTKALPGIGAWVANEFYDWCLRSYDSAVSFVTSVYNLVYALVIKLLLERILLGFLYRYWLELSVFCALA